MTSRSLFPGGEKVECEEHRRWVWNGEVSLVKDGLGPVLFVGRRVLGPTEIMVELGGWEKGGGGGCRCPGPPREPKSRGRG